MGEGGCGLKITCSPFDLKFKYEGTMAGNQSEAT